MEKADIGLIGLGVMGQNLALNLADKGWKVVVWNRTVPGKEENVVDNFIANRAKGKGIIGSNELTNFCCPNGKFSSLSVNTYSSGISSSLHLFRIVPFLISINPGLERTIVFRVISSI